MHLKVIGLRVGGGDECGGESGRKMATTVLKPQLKNKIKLIIQCFVVYS